MYSLGKVDSIKNGFSFKITCPDQTELDRCIKIGLYNTEEFNPWTNGYLLILSARATKGSVGLALRKGIDETLLAIPEDLVDLTSSELRVDVWLTDTDAANGAHTFHVKINGKEVITYTNTDGSVIVGPYMGAYNERSQKMEFKTIKEAQEIVVPDTSGDVDFMDLGQTMKLNSVVCPQATSVDLGQVKSVKNGFIFKVSVPSASDAGKNIKIGLYNMAKKNPWTDGYILVLSPREEEGTLGFALRKGKDEALLAFPEDLTGITDEFLEIKVWLTDTGAEGGAHTFHVMVNGKEIITYTNADGSVGVGTYMAAYNEGATPIEFRTIEEVMEPSDLYLAKFGDPTAMRKDSGKDSEQDDADKASKLGNSLIYVIGGIAIVAVGVAAAGAVVLKRRKKTEND